MIDASCHCGAVHFTVDAPPATLSQCNCSICRRSGALWAYYPPAQVRFAAANGPTDVYMWGDRSLALHRCRICGCITHWSPVDPALDRMGVNVRLMPPEVLAPTPIVQIDGAAW